MVVGDQLLEICGINLRTATEVLAKTVLSHCGKSVTILLQNNHDKYEEMTTTTSIGEETTTRNATFLYYYGKVVCKKRIYIFCIIFFSNFCL